MLDYVNDKKYYENATDFIIIELYCFFWFDFNIKVLVFCVFVILQFFIYVYIIYT